MKKSLVFAMAMALGVSATAFAANPFSDLPAGHWAYGAVAKLAAAGIVDGYPDGTFKGDKTMTRYEMAQIVAKALAKGAIGADDKLVSEFADELDNLGVRVAKLEKNADNVKITGNIRTIYNQSYGDLKNPSSSVTRSRLFFTGEVNDNWHYVGMLQNQQHWINHNDKNDSGETETKFQRAYVTGNIGVVNMTAGRYNGTYADGNVYDTRVDAVNLSGKSGVTYIGATWGKMANKDVVDQDDDKFSTKDSIAGEFTQAVVGADWGKWNLEANYFHVKDIDTTDLKNGSTGWMTGSDNIWTAAATWHADDWKIGAMYLHGDADDKVVKDAKSDAEPDHDGWVATVAYKGAKASKPGSWGLFAHYYDQGGATYIAHTMNGNYDKFGPEGFKGWNVGANWAIAKNMVATVEYYDLKGRSNSDDYKDDQHARTLWSQMIVTF